MEKKIKFAVVGCGHIGKRHATIIMNNPACELVGICDTAGKEVLDPGDDKIPFYASLDELLASGFSMDVVCIATPNGLHEEQAIKVLEAGCHVLIEKPMALSSAGCRRIMDAAEQWQRQVFCVMQNRHSPAAAWLKEVVENKILGDIYIVQVNGYWNRDERYYTGTNWHGTQQMDGGTLFTQFSHFIDAVYWLFGDIKDINARFHNFDHNGLIDFEDTGFVHFNLVNGGSGTFNYSTAVWKENLESSMTIIAANGTVKIAGQYMDAVEYCNIKDYTLPALDSPGVNHQYVFDKLVNVLQPGVSLTSNAMDGMKIVEIIERIYKAGQLTNGK